MDARPRVLIACEFSGVVRDAFLAVGCDAVSCDVLPTTSPGPHIQDDVTLHLDDGWDLMIAHPPCTRLCATGVMWLEKKNLWQEMEEAALFFRIFLEAPIPYIAVENPVMHGYAQKIVGRSQDFSVHPWEFGDAFKKRTCFWTKNLPPLAPHPLANGENAMCGKDKYSMHPESDRHKGLHLGLKRSVTFPRLARAMAKQWDPRKQQIPIFD